MTNQSVLRIDAKTLAISPLPFATANAWIGPPGIVVLADGSNHLELIEATESGYRDLCDVLATNVTSTAYSLAKHLVAFGSGTNFLTCVSLEPFGQRFELTGGKGVLRVSRFTGGGRLLIGSDEDRNVLLWDAEERRLVHTFDDSNHGELTVAPDCREIVTSGRNHELLFRDFTNPEKILARAPIPPSNIFLSFSPDYRWLAVAVEDLGSVQLFDMKSRKLERTFQRHLIATHGVAFSPDGRRLASGGDLDEAVKLWDVETGQELLTLAGPAFGMYSVQCSDDGNFIMAGRPGFRGTWQLWRAPSWKEIDEIERKGGGWEHMPQ